MNGTISDLITQRDVTTNERDRLAGEIKIVGDDKVAAYEFSLKYEVSYDA